MVLVLLQGVVDIAHADDATAGADAEHDVLVVGVTDKSTNADGSTELILLHCDCRVVGTLVMELLLTVDFATISEDSAADDVAIFADTVAVVGVQLMVGAQDTDTMLLAFPMALLILLLIFWAASCSIAAVVDFGAGATDVVVACCKWLCELASVCCCGCMWTLC